MPLVHRIAGLLKQWLVGNTKDRCNHLIWIITLTSIHFVSIAGRPNQGENLFFPIDTAGNANRSCGAEGAQRWKSFALRFIQLIKNTICCSRWSQVDTPKHYFINLNQRLLEIKLGTRVY